MESKPKIGPALFFCVQGRVLFHGCTLDEAESYGDFMNYPYSHDEIWRRSYKRLFNVDFDYFPRGRVVYRKTDDTYIIYYDSCMEEYIKKVSDRYEGNKIAFGYDEHYKCHTCNEEYVL